MDHVNPSRLLQYSILAFLKQKSINLKGWGEISKTTCWSYHKVYYSWVITPVQLEYIKADNFQSQDLKVHLGKKRQRQKQPSLFLLSIIKIYYRLNFCLHLTRIYLIGVLLTFDTEAQKSIRSTLIFSLLILFSNNISMIIRFHLLIRGLPIPPSSKLISFKIMASYYDHTILNWFFILCSSWFNKEGYAQISHVRFLTLKEDNLSSVFFFKGILMILKARLSTFERNSQSLSSHYLEITILRHPLWSQRDLYPPYVCEWKKQIYSKQRDTQSIRSRCKWRSFQNQYLQKFFQQILLFGEDGHICK